MEKTKPTTEELAIIKKLKGIILYAINNTNCEDQRLIVLALLDCVNLYKKL